MASQWRTFQRFLRDTEHLVFTEAPKLIRQLQQPNGVQRAIQQGLQQGIRLGIEVLVANAGPPETRVAITAGRPVARVLVPTARRARRVVYAPDLDGRADPGEVVWTWVVYEDDPTKGKDRPVLVVGRERSTLLGLMLSSQARHAHEPGWVHVGTGSWDSGYEDGEGRPSWVRLDPVLDVPEESIRREGAVMDRATFEVVAARLRAEYFWS
ncbi:MAG: type II toxin-antitoxin system PemK/MazF family toxin [Mycobacterium sp.]|nr:type II toxin-antitoxin system PemK/MazF family toxin [Mycobacterium sp.]